MLVATDRTKIWQAWVDVSVGRSTLLSVLKCHIYRDISFGNVTRPRVGQPKNRNWSPDKRMIFLYSTAPWPTLELTQANDRNRAGESWRERGLFVGDKMAGACKWQITPPSVEIRNMWSYNSIPSFIKSKDSFTFIVADKTLSLYCNTDC
jgi:hypothetical protein